MKTLKEATHQFYNEFYPDKNIAAIGQGANEIVVYLIKKEKRKDHFPTSYEGFPVELIVSGEFKLCKVNYGDFLRKD